MSVAIVACKCQNDFQDKRYGKGGRVANGTEKAAPNGSRVVRCTVCKTEHLVNETRLQK